MILAGGCSAVMPRQQVCTAFSRRSYGPMRETGRQTWHFRMAQSSSRPAGGRFLYVNVRTPMTSCRPVSAPLDGSAIRIGAFHVRNTPDQADPMANNQRWFSDTYTRNAAISPSTMAKAEVRRGPAHSARPQADVSFGSPVSLRSTVPLSVIGRRAIAHPDRYIYQSRHISDDR